MPNLFVHPVVCESSGVDCLSNPCIPQWICKKDPLFLEGYHFVARTENKVHVLGYQGIES